MKNKKPGRLIDSPERKLVYREARDGVLLIGTHHDQLSIIPRKEIESLKAAVERMDTLYFEGFRSMFHGESEIAAREQKKFIEWVAYNHHRGESKFLDAMSPLDYPASAQRHGMDAKMYAALFAANSAMEVVRMGITNSGEACTVAGRHLGRMRRYARGSFPESLGICEKVAAVGVTGSIRYSLDFGTIEPVKEATDTFMAFIARIRDREQYGPLLVERVSGAPGKKGVIMGSRHLDNMLHVLGGGELDMPAWSQYVAGMSYEARTALAYLQAAIEEIGL